MWRSLKGLFALIYTYIRICGILGQSALPQPLTEISLFEPQPYKMLEGQLKTQPKRGHEDNDPVALVGKEAAQKGLCQKPNLFSIKGRRNNKQGLPSSPSLRRVFYPVGVAVLARRQGSLR